VHNIYSLGFTASLKQGPRPSPLNRGSGGVRTAEIESFVGCEQGYSWQYPKSLALTWPLYSKSVSDG